VTAPAAKSRWPWRTIAYQCGQWGVILLAVQGVLFSIGSTPMSVRDLAVVFIGGCVVTALMLRRNPAYYDRRGVNPEA